MRSGDRLRLIAYDFADGTRTYDQHVFHDRDLHEDCTVQVFSSGERYCLPMTAAGTIVFTTSDCTRALGAINATEPPHFFIRPYSLHGTSLPSRLYRPGAQADSPGTVWRQQDEFCAGPFAPPADHTFFELGEEIRPDKLVRIRERETLTVGRLTFGIDTTDDGWHVPGAVVDMVAGPCTLLPSANADTAPCLPSARATPFSDAQCTQPLASDEVAAHRDVDSGCWSLLEPGAPFTGQAYERIGETCVAVGSSEPFFTPAAISEAARLLRRVDENNRRLAAINLGTNARDAFLHDDTLVADCQIIQTAAGYTCAPVSAVTALPFFDDSACSVPIHVAFVPTGSCEPPSVFADGFRIGDLRTAPIYEVTTGDRCAAFAPPARFAVHSLEAVPTTDVVTATRSVD